MRYISSAAIIAVISGCSASADPNAAGAGLSDPKVVAELREMGLRACSHCGVPSPKTLVAVAASDHDAAEMIVSGAPAAEEPAANEGPIIYDHASVYVIVATGGTFTSTTASVPSGAAFPKGTVLNLTVDAATLRVTDDGIADEEPDLDKIGSVQVNLLAK